MNKSFLDLMFGTLLVGLTISVGSAAVQPPSQPATGASGGELSDRVRSLELQVKSLEEKHAQATALQAEYRGFYEKAFDAQKSMVWAIGILLTAMLAVAGGLSFWAFERQTEAVIKSVVTEFRVSMEEKLRSETQALTEKNQKQVSDAIDRLTKEFQAKVTEIEFRIAAEHLFDSGVAFAALKQYDDAIEILRRFVKRYSQQIGVKVIERSYCATAIRNIFVALNWKDPDKFPEVAKQELSKKLYGQLREEVILAGQQFKKLSDLLFEIGWKVIPENRSDQGSAEEKPEDEKQT
ncbi:MAG: hypothetical protein ABSB82_07780 [Terriglobia bacterium]|jgi:TolA-binding protein